MTDHSPPPRRRVGCLSWIALLAAGLFALWAAWFGSVRWQLSSELAKIRAAGDPVSIEDLAADPVPNEENAAWVLEHSPILEQFEKAYGSFESSDAWRRIDERDAPTAEDYEQLEAFLADQAIAIEVADRASSCEAYQPAYVSGGVASPIDPLLPNLQRLRSVSRLTSLRSTLLTHKGNLDAAAEAGIRSLRLARLSRQDALMVSLLVGVAIDGIAVEDLNRALRAGAIAPDLRQRLDEELALHDDPQERVRALKCERAFNLSRLAAPPDFGPMTAIKVGLLKWYRQEFTIVDQPWHAVRNEIDQGPQLKAPASLLVPAVRSMYVAHNRMITHTRCLRVLNALQAFAEENGRRASGLDDLDLPTAAKTDPFTGKPLVCEWREDAEGGRGWWIYSLMENSTDESGRFDDASDYGLAPIGASTGDPSADGVSDFE